MDEKNQSPRSVSELQEDIERLNARLEDAEQILGAIRKGEVDAFVIAGPRGDQIFSLASVERTYRIIVETMNEAALTVDPEGTILFCNNRFCILMKSLMKDTIGQKVISFVAPAQRAPLLRILDDARTGPVRRPLTLKAADGTPVSVQIAASLVVVDEQTSICLVVSDLTELEASANSIRILTEQQKVLEERTHELEEANTALHDSRLAALNLMDDTLNARRAAEEANNGLRLEIAERKRMEVDLQKAHDELAKMVEERTRELREKEVLLKEIHHRVKNNMQIISSLVSLQAEGSMDAAVREVLSDVTDRVRSMALIHEKLYQSADLASINFADYARGLLNYIWRSHGAAASSVILELDLEPVTFSVETAVPLGLILNELAGNALKHAFKGRSGGKVTVLLAKNDGRSSLSVSDNGTGLPEGLDWRQGQSLGLRLVQMLSAQIGASVEADWGEGTRFTISFG